VARAIIAEDGHQVARRVGGRRVWGADLEVEELRRDNTTRGAAGRRRRGRRRRRGECLAVGAGVVVEAAVKGAALAVTEAWGTFHMCTGLELGRVGGRRGKGRDGGDESEGRRDSREGQHLALLAASEARK